MKNLIFNIAVCSVLLLLSCCGGDDAVSQDTHTPPVQNTEIKFGADLSYVNQILDHGGSYQDGGVTKDPFQIFKDHGTNLVRVRLWHNPVWTKEVYGEQGTQLYDDLKDVEKSIKKSKDLGMPVLLDFHYSDTWADPAKQFIPAAWKNIKTIAVLRDSVYNYTSKVLSYLSKKGLQPEYVQLGNETNCGMFYSEAASGFPTCEVCQAAQWQNIGQVLNAGIKAVRDVNATSAIKTKIALHVADPKNVQWWFDNIKAQASVTDFDIIGFSYYPLWHTTIALNDISTTVSSFKTRFGKDVLVLETAYPFTNGFQDSFGNMMGGEPPISGFPFTEQGQYDYMVKLTREVKEGGGLGVIYWEPGWISSNMKTLYGTGSAWENAAYFNFQRNALKVMDYTRVDYSK
jgi:arabinogalactan endo-1,4-beta-galactosidase